jgi:hypothetical protein
MAANPGYKNKAGKRVPRVTTILNQMHKPALLPAAVKLERAGTDHEKAWAIRRDAGSWCHWLIGEHLGAADDTPDVGEESRELGACAFENWLVWWDDLCEHETVKIVAVEEGLVSEEMQVGGTPDLVAWIDGNLYLLDWKTASTPRVYEAAAIQTACYAEMWNEVRGEEIGRIDYTLVVSIPTAPFRSVVTSDGWGPLDRKPAFNVFKSLRDMHTGMAAVRKMVK